MPVRPTCLPIFVKQRQQNPNTSAARTADGQIHRGGDTDRCGRPPAPARVQRQIRPLALNPIENGPTPDRSCRSARRARLRQHIRPRQISFGAAHRPPPGEFPEWQPGAPDRENRYQPRRAVFQGRIPVQMHRSWPCFSRYLAPISQIIGSAAVTRGGHISTQALCVELAGVRRYRNGLLRALEFPPSAPTPADLGLRPG